jgi:hypothetical protein
VPQMQNCLEIRWKIVSGDNTFTNHAKKILDGSET